VACKTSGLKSIGCDGSATNEFLVLIFFPTQICPGLNRSWSFERTTGSMSVRIGDSS
jgi:hypothetical protein